MRLICSVVIYILLISCCRDKTDIVHFSKFKHQLYLDGSCFELENPISGCLMYNSDSLLILSPIWDSDHQIQLYDLNTFKFIRSSGIIGRGPSEITSESLTSYYNKILYYQDAGRHKLMAFNVDSIVKFPNYESKLFIELPNILFLTYFDTYNDSIFSYVSDKENTLISFFNSKGELIDTMDIIDKSPIYNLEDLTYESKNYMASYLFTINKSRNTIAIVYATSDVIKFLDLKGNELKVLYGPNDHIQIPEYGNLKQKMTNTLVKSDNDFIYCLYQNNTLLDEASGFTPIRTNLINVYSWSGIPTAQLILNHPIQTFTVDRKNNRIVTYAPDVDAFEVYQYPDVLLTEIYNENRNSN